MWEARDAWLVSGFVSCRHFPSGFVRLMYHCPAYAIMDESTSAMDVPLEEQCLRRCIDRGISFISVGHRPTLRAFHTQLLVLDRNGKYTLESLSDEAAAAAAGSHSSNGSSSMPSFQAVDRSSIQQTHGAASSSLAAQSSKRGRVGAGAVAGGSGQAGVVDHDGTTSGSLKQGLLSGGDHEDGVGVDVESGGASGGIVEKDGVNLVEEAKWDAAEKQRDENPWDSAQVRYQQPDGSVKLDWELMGKLWRAFRVGE